MTNSNGKSKLQRLVDQKSQSGQRSSISKLIERMHPDDPVRPIVEAIGEVQNDVTEMRSEKVDSQSTSTAQGLSEEQIGTLRSQLKAAIKAAAQAVAQDKSQDYALQWVLAMSMLAGVCVLGGGAIGYWISESKSAEARRYWDWNQNLIRECQKQDRKTCNTHVVPPEQW